MEGPEWYAQTHGPLQPGSGAEKTVISGGGGEGGHRKVFQHPWASHGDGDLIKIPGKDDLGSRQRLLGSSKEIFSVEDSLEEDVAHPQQGGGGAAGVRLLLKCCVTGSTDLQIEYLVRNPPHGQGLGPSGHQSPSYDPFIQQYPSNYIPQSLPI